MPPGVFVGGGIVDGRKGFDKRRVPCHQGNRKVGVIAESPHPRRFAAPPLPLKR